MFICYRFNIKTCDSYDCHFVFKILALRVLNMKNSDQLYVIKVISTLMRTFSCCSIIFKRNLTPNKNNRSYFSKRPEKLRNLITQ